MISQATKTMAIRALEVQRIHIQMMDLSKDHEAREFAAIDAALAELREQSQPQQEGEKK